MNWQKIAIGMAGAIVARKAADHILVNHPRVAGALAAPVRIMRDGGDVLSALDLTRPHTILTTLANIIEDRPVVSSKDEEKTMPPALMAALNLDGWSICQGVNQGDWDTVYREAWQVVNNWRGTDAYTVKPYFGRFWLLTLKGDAPLTGWVLESKTNPMIGARARGYLECNWWCAVVRRREDRRSHHALGPEELTREEMHELAWHDAHRRVEFDIHRRLVDGGEMASWSIHAHEHQPYEYIGAESAYKARWTRMLRERRPFNVMIYGRPGCGKTTLMRSWFEEERVRVVEIKAADLIDAAPRIHQVFQHAPDVLLIEDFDRIKVEDSGRLLWLFEHSAQDKLTSPYENQPMIFATSNHPNRIADAFFRPGRFDQIIEVAPPPPDQWPRLIHEIGARVGLDAATLTTTQRERTHHILGALSVAHLEQYLQRVAIDPAYIDLASDRTFSPPVTWEG